ncbi:MAG: N-acetylmuramic acid 6-phosphate etherase [Ignavibacteria bacterium GWF2_33_9]|nr:MAG: N-acetylmuramic acid 6-phosphate etherase [Ignavibacteria bacterium GWF2_33_9]
MQNKENKYLFEEIIALSTEQINENTKKIDEVSTLEILTLINNEDKNVPLVVESELEHIAQAVGIIVDSIKKGGRLIYIGAGTSGRLGVVDASECPPTFGAPHGLIIGLIAGGPAAMFAAQEGAEDNPFYAKKDLQMLNISERDVICGIAASGRTPYVVAGVNFAKSKGCKTLMISTSEREQVLTKGINADVFICPHVGPEPITGSTRMKSGTAQKLVLNMLTTAAFVQLGKTYGNVMVDLQQTNAKLKERSKNIIMQICEVDYERATDLLQKSGSHVKTALIMGLANCDKDSAQTLLANSDGKIKTALKEIEISG